MQIWRELLSDFCDFTRKVAFCWRHAPFDTLMEHHVGESTQIHYTADGNQSVKHWTTEEQVGAVQLLQVLLLSYTLSTPQKIMSTQPADAIPDGELHVPLPAPIQHDMGMGALASAAAVKRPGEPEVVHNAQAAKKAKYAPPMAVDPAVWESLMSQVRGQLRAMGQDECFSRALELQMLAKSEVSNRSQHLSNAMELMANPHGQPMAGQPKMKRHPPNMSVASGQRVTKAEREVSKQKPIKTNKSTPVPCMKMTPPLPPRCEVDNAPNQELPPFVQLVNFPTARYYGNCVMCDESEFQIPKQNKGVCNNCDVAIWVVNPSGMTIKWCKGCKNFRKWIEFGVKVCTLHDICFYQYVSHLFAIDYASF